MEINTAYMMQNLRKRFLTLFFDVPVTYLGLVLSLTVILFSIETPSYGYIILLGTGFILHLIFFFSLKKTITIRFIFKVLLDLAIGLGIVFIAGIWFEIVIVVFTVLYLLYYALMVTVSYQQLSFTSADTLKELNKRHNSTLKKK
jgi:hypothetical protein